MSSTWKQNIKKKYDEHRHCLVCGISIPPDREFCSIECKDKYANYDKKKKRSTYIQLIMIFGIMMVMMVILPLLGGG